MRRDFLATSEAIDGKYRSVYVMTCCFCGESESIGSGGKGQVLHNTFIAQKFEQKGWFVGRQSDGHDVCPKCVEEKKRNRKMTEQKNVVELKPQADPPRQMKFDDRRVILAKIEEVYLDETRGYDKGWSDNRVATDLGVPRAWVTKLREENFGPSGINEDMLDYVQQAEALLLKAQETKAEALEIAKRATDLHVQIMAQLKDMERGLSKIDTFKHRMDGIEALMEKIRKLAAL